VKKYAIIRTKNELFVQLTLKLPCDTIRRLKEEPHLHFGSEASTKASFEKLISNPKNLFLK